jgi:hypothetical protein
MTITILPVPDEDRIRRAKVAVDKRLTVLGASPNDDAAGTFDPEKLLDGLERTYRCAEREHHSARTAIAAAQRALAEAFGHPPPTSDGTDGDDATTVRAATFSVQRQRLNMSDPPPRRQVAYFTYQLRRGLTDTYHYGWNSGRRRLEQEREALRAAWRANRWHTDKAPHNEAQRAAIAAAQALAP